MPRQTRIIDPRISDALRAAEDRLTRASVFAFTEALDTLLERMRSAATYHERGQYAAAHTELLKQRDTLQAAFATALRGKVDAAVQAEDPEHRAPEETDWDALSLVEPDQIEERISFERIGQVISHACEAELRELNAYTSAMLQHGWTDPERNPLRGNVIGSALHAAIEASIEESATHKLLGSELGHALAKALPTCYRSIIDELTTRGFRPADLSVRRAAPPSPTAGGPAPSLDAPPGRWEASASPQDAGEDSRFDESRSRWERSLGSPGPGSESRFEDSRRWDRSLSGRADSGDTVRSWNSSILGRYGNIDPVPPEYFSDSAASLLDRLLRGGIKASGGGRAAPSYNPAPPQADADLMGLLRRLNERSMAMQPSALPGSTASGVPTNIIRAHREELLQASQGKLDHLLIEVVSNLFDQILSDKRMSPQMAVQIARLQLPVLRVALRDPSFFSSRRHPVRRFANRVAALGTGIEDFEKGTGKELLVRIGRLISEIVEGDFDQIALYEIKLLDLEQFTTEQLRAEVKAGPAGATLEAKEFEWLAQSRFVARLQEALEPLALPAFLKQFLGQVWAQVIFSASLSHGAASTQAQQFRRAGYDLVVSIQPKLTLKQRMDFLSNLPGLMAHLNNGMALVEWPSESRGEFLGKMVSEHAGSLKAAPASELDYNMLLRDAEAAFKTPIPGRDELAKEQETAKAAAPLSQAQPAVVEQRFSAEEAKKLGLLAEEAVNWSSAVVDEPAAAVDTVRTASQPAPADSNAGRGAPGPVAAVAIPVAAADAAEPTEGPQLRHHLQLGISYQLQLKDHWEKVRLAYMSPSRSLFLFTYGSKDRQSISMTARMLERLCDARRMRTFEAASLIDRAAANVQRHLAALKLPPRRAAG